jgi:Uma2 family endonuclease
MVQVPAKTFTLQEFLKLPETKPASEYINGQIIQKPMPQGKHGKLQGKLVTAINQVVEERHIALAFPELRCTFGGRSLVPDVAVFAWEKIPVDEIVRNVRLGGDKLNLITRVVDLNYTTASGEKATITIRNTVYTSP